MSDRLTTEHSMEALQELIDEFGRTSEAVGRSDGMPGYDPGRHYKNEECDEAKVYLVQAVTGLYGQLPEDMKQCTIQFIECDKGHGRLTAMNWIDRGCPWCLLLAAEDRIRHLEAEVYE